MTKFLLAVLCIAGLVVADQEVILVLKTTPKPGLETETIALPDIVMSRLSKYPNYRSVAWDEIEGKLGKDRMAEIQRCQDSSCVVNFTSTVRQYRLNPSYMLFCSIDRYDANYTITLKIVDAVKGTSFGMVSTTSSSLETFHTSGIIESVIKKIPAYVSRSSGAADNKPGMQIPGLSALGRDSSYFGYLTSTPSELKNYINIFSYHDERKGLFINTAVPVDTIRFPSVAVYKFPSSDSFSKKSFFTISFLDTIVKNRDEVPFSVLFNKGAANQISQVAISCGVPSQTRYASDFIDLKTSFINKIVSSGFTLVKADSMTGLYGVNYHYYYTTKYDISDVTLAFTAESSKFSVIIDRH